MVYTDIYYNIFRELWYILVNKEYRKLAVWLRRLNIGAIHIWVISPRAENDC